MSVNNERIFIVGGTGNIGTALVRELLAKNAAVTLFTRSPDKVNALFSRNPLIRIVQGDLQNLTVLKEAIKGHTRLFILVGGLDDGVPIKTAIATYGYEAGVRQVVDISSVYASASTRGTLLGDFSQREEEEILRIPNRGYFVALRPGRFMSNMFYVDPPRDDVITDTSEPDELCGWISPNDIGAVAAVVLTDDVEKHKDFVYELNGDAVTGNQRAEIFTRILGRSITYKKVSAVEYYNTFITKIYPNNHRMGYDLATKKVCFDKNFSTITDGIEILLGRKPETVEEFLIKNKHRFK
ncbi:hypothetical protein G6F70_007659 [Rhizopus microsporus]|uniref:NmrA-like domain-containing protein n=1 Tax=Rhizopus azygosporus TaxID=86630 RepID=A0A367JUF1_RHIAZ|nr:hypothetical protein G6F71_007672 [Rhizopus microsporus]RCH93479.1 hypothetical protein CU097_008115 [Rhizopus azygosporus]KAG1196164.1 hypothetical protein G6F70_007659 [Rhizopus microsporus]KAG1207937.1 hypothetical protein G6F69_007641 [Rhizopus microsporus]KAG1228950.1 hypothetical protein G6F67_007492 [Rhizopus microsporus]